jgi:hypothetical protein
LQNAELQKQALFGDVDELRERAARLARDVEEKDALQTQYRDVMQVFCLLFCVILEQFFFLAVVCLLVAVCCCVDVIHFSVV